MIQHVPDEITEQLVQKYIDMFKSNESYKKGDKAIEELIIDFPENIEFYQVLAKVCVINDLYQTVIISTNTVAEHIVELNIDQGLRRGDLNIVNKIAEVKHNNKKRIHYSFATKYCAWHKPEYFPMYDRYVHKMLMAYFKKDKDRFCNIDFKACQLREYPKFKDAIDKFKDVYNLRKYAYRELDYFLWEYGKELFDKNANKPKE